MKNEKRNEMSNLPIEDLTPEQVKQIKKISERLSVDNKIYLFTGTLQGVETNEEHGICLEMFDTLAHWIPEHEMHELLEIKKDHGVGFIAYMFPELAKFKPENAATNSLWWKTSDRATRIMVLKDIITELGGTVAEEE